MADATLTSPASLHSRPQTHNPNGTPYTVWPTGTAATGYPA